MAKKLVHFVELTASEKRDAIISPTIVLRAAACGDERPAAVTFDPTDLDSIGCAACRDRAEQVRRTLGHR